MGSSMRRSAGTEAGAHPLPLARGLRAAWLLVLLGALVGARPGWPATGGFRVLDARTYLDGKIYRLDANLRLRFGKAAREALDSGVPLIIDIQIRVARSRRWLWDDVAAELHQRYRIQYHALSDRYLVENLNTHALSSHPGLADAERTLGTLRGLPLIDSKLLAPRGHYRVALRVRLDVEALPTPMRLWAYVSRDWDLGSEWYSWALTP